MFTTVVVSDEVTVNGLKLNEVTIPEHVDLVNITNPDMSCKFLEHHIVIRLIGTFAGIKQALKYFRPVIVDVARIDTDDQIADIPTGQLTIVRDVAPNVNWKLFGPDTFLPNKPRLSGKEVFELCQTLAHGFIMGTAPTNAGAIKATILDNLDSAIADFAKTGDMDSIAKLETWNKWILVKFTTDDHMKEIIAKHCQAPK